MSTRQKNLEKMRNNPHDWRIDQLEAVAVQYGIKVRKSGGSHAVFHHASWIEMLCVPGTPSH